MRVLVTGASGFLGSHIAEQLARDGHEVRTLVRHSSNRRFLAGFPHEEAVGDVSEPASLRPALAGIDAVVHAAGLVKARSAAEFEAINAGGTANLLAAADEAAPGLHRFVFVSSLAAHGPSEDGRPRPADAPAHPLTAYGRSKLHGEELVRGWRGADRAVIIRPATVYGPRDPALLPFFKAVRWRIAPLLAGGRNRISIIYAVDAARAIAQVVTAQKDISGKVYSLDDGNIYSWRDLLTAIEGAVGHRALRISSPRWAFYAAAIASEGFGFLLRRPVMLTREKVLEMSQPAWVCSHAALSEEIGWSPRVDITEGAKLTAQWYREQRWL
ncbi:MAG: NAD-dependent epimerase/dehydratase family protein [Dehalococcoidia bacterium]